MAKERYVNTKFWDDSYIIKLDPIEKLLFLYFLTNPLTNIAGIYEISTRRIAFDTGIDAEMTLTILKRFENDKKMFYKDGWLIICNFPKYQKYEQNPKIHTGINLILNQIPDNLKRDIDNLSIPYAYPLNYSNSNSNLNSNSNIDTAETSSAKPSKKDKLNDKTPMTLQEFIDWCKLSPQKHIQIIGDYAEEKKLDFSTKGQWNSFVNRNVRAARQLSPYSDKQISEAMEKISKKKYLTEWTLETLNKFLDHK